MIAKETVTCAAAIVVRVLERLSDGEKRAFQAAVADLDLESMKVAHREMERAVTGQANHLDEALNCAVATHHFAMEIDAKQQAREEGAWSMDLEGNIEWRPKL